MLGSVGPFFFKIIFKETVAVFMNVQNAGFRNAVSALKTQNQTFRNPPLNMILAVQLLKETVAEIKLLKRPQSEVVHT